MALHTSLRNQRLIDLGAESADRRRNVRKAIRTNTLGVRCLLQLSLVAFHLDISVSAGDWPMYRHDARRSAVSTETLEFPLNLAWHRNSPRPPQPAFADPLRHSTGFDFAHVRDFSQPVQLTFDHAFHPVAADGRVFFGSSADDSVRCVSLKTGAQLWVFVTGGPVRFAPQVVEDRVYLASDDGFVYCLAAETGQLVWQFRAAPSARQLVGNGRMISRWPLRTGVVVVDGILYVTAGMWPSEGVFVYALNAETGEVKWVNDTSGTVNLPTANPGAYAISGVGPTGYLLSGTGALVVPTGRSMPASYSLEDGTLLKSYAASYQNRRGGPVTCIDPHGSVIFGYPRERLTGTGYSVQYIYRLPNLQQYGTMRGDRILADKQTYLVVNDLIRCATFNPRYTSSRLVVHWQVDCPSKSVHCMALSANVLLAGVDNSIVARSRETGEAVWQHGDLDGNVLSIAIVDGQLLAATDAGSIYCFGGESTSKSAPLEVTSPSPNTKAVEPLDSQLKTVLTDERIDRGLALVIGHRDTKLAEQIAADSRLQVVLLLDDADQVTAARQDLIQRSPLGSGQVSVQKGDPQKPLPFSDFAFNVIVSTGEAVNSRAEELQRVLRPAGGILFVEDSTAEEIAKIETTLAKIGALPGETRRAGNALVYRRGKLAGALDWDSETTRDKRVKWPLELLWFGGPGSKRTGSGSRPPVAAGGRNLVVGNNHLIALDAYNGTELWSRVLPYLYRNIGRLRNAPGPIQPWLTKSISADDDHVWLNFGHVVVQLDAATGEQLAMHGELPAVEKFSLQDKPQFVLDHFRKPDLRGTASTPAKVEVPAGSIQLRESADAKNLQVILQLDPGIEIAETLYWELFFDVRPPDDRSRLFERGIFQFLVRPALSRVETGMGPAHPNVSVEVKDGGRQTVLTIPVDELTRLGGGSLDSFSFAAALNHKASDDQKEMAVGRGYLRWEFHADAFATSFNNGWPLIIRNGNADIKLAKLPPISDLPERSTKNGRIGGVGKKAGYVVNVSLERENPLSLDISAFEYNRGKGCGNPVFADTLHVLRSGTLAFYDLDDDSGMRYFGGVRPGCTIGAVPAQGLVFAAESSSGCSCNYNFKTTLALAPAKQRRNEDWAMYTAPLSPAALLQTGRFNLGAPGDRRDDEGGLWLQYPRAPTLSNRTMPVPVELFGTLKPFRVNADRVPIAGTDRPWLYASGLEGIEKIRLQLFMSDKEGVVVFPGDSPKLDAKLEDAAWERRYAVPAGTGSSLLLSHDSEALYVGYEVVPPLDRRGKRLPWTTKGTLPHSTSFSVSDKADDAAVWEEDSLEFLVSDVSLKTILHFGIGVTGGRYDGVWSLAKKTQDPAIALAWSGSAEITADKAVAEFSLPWKTLADAGLDLDNLVIRPRTKKPLTRQPHITHGFRPVLVQKDQPGEKRYRVTLHFAELSNISPGERVFDVEVQGKTVLKNFDPVLAAGGRHRAISRTFEGIPASRALEIRFVSSSVGERKTLPPVLSAVEVLIDK
jgi:outer membrane protein assembly factor BamB